MKILIDARLYGLENAGLGRYTINLIDELVKIDKKNTYVLLLRKVYFNQLNLPENWKKVLADFRHYSLIEQIKLPAIISREKPDLAHFPHFNVPVFYKGKYVVTIHDLLMQAHRGVKATTLPMYIYYPKHLGSKIVFRNAVKKAAKIIVPSQSVKDEVIQFYKVREEDVKVTHEGFDKRILVARDSSQILRKYGLAHSRYFIYVGNAYPHKNLEKAIKAIKRVNEESANKVLFVISCSRNIFSEKLLKMIKKEEAEDCVKFLGFVPDNDLGILYKNSLAFIYPSLSEGFGLPGLEAFSSGTLVLASNIPVFKEVYSNKALYFNPYNYLSIAQSIKKVIDLDPEIRQRMLEGAKDFVKRYSWSKMARETLKIYEGCASLRSDK